MFSVYGHYQHHGAERSVIHTATFSRAKAELCDQRGLSVIQYVRLFVVSFCLCAKLLQK